MYCAEILKTSYFFFSSEVPVLIYYSHIPSIVVVSLLSVLLLTQKKTLPSILLLILNTLFIGIVLANLTLWTNSDLQLLTFLWPITQIFFASIPVTALFLFYSFTSSRTVPVAYKLLWSIPPVLVAGLSFSALNISYADATSCEVVTTHLMDIIQGIEFAIVLAWLLVAAFFKVSSIRNRRDRAKTVLLAAGLFFFLALFAITWNLASIIDNFTLEQYGLYGMVAFMALLTYLIVAYKAFNIGLVAAQALVVALIVLIGAQFAYVRNPTSVLLTGVALVFTGIIGIILIRSVKREIELRQHVEVLAKDLEKSNQQQIILIHFITHQIKGFVSKSRNIFAGLREGDYGVLPEAMVPMVEEGFRSDTKGAQTIQEILNAANIKSGKVSYAKEPFDLKALVQEVVNDLNPLAAKKGLQLTSTLDDVTFTGDKIQLVNAFKNLIDNSIKYTPSGSVAVTLNKTDKTVHFEIKDTGVGITEEDMKNLFTEGGHGKNSQKVNVESTGFGLFIVKNIVEAHNGKVWAESEGEGKGSLFIVELPV